MEQPYNVQLEVYEGPLDLLLDLIRKQEIDIYDIPIAQITRQYLEYLHRLEELNIDIAADFIFMAATLIQIKSRMLLPPDPTLPPELLEDPRMELVHRLLEHEKFKNAAQMLQQKQMLEEAMWSKPEMKNFEVDDAEAEIAVTLFDLVKVFRQILERAKEPPHIDIQKEEVTVGQMIAEMRRVLAASNEPLSLNEFFRGCRSRVAMIAALLAILEMVRLQAIVLTQPKTFDEILVRKHKMFDTVFGQSLEAQVDGQYQ